MNILQEIFIDYFEEIKYTLHPRDTEIENIDKMINCGDPSFGGAMYSCTHCGRLNLRSFSLEDRSLLNCLFHAVTSVVNRMFLKVNKSKNFTPGFSMVLHTFGRDPKWNPSTVVKYIGRPVIATSRIDKYDGEPPYSLPLAMIL